MSRSLTGLDMSPLGSQSAFIAQVELRETPARVRDATAALRRLLKERKDLYFRDDDDFLIRFLRPTKFYPESALQLMINIAKFKKKYQKYVDNLAPKDEINTIREHNILNLFLERDQSGRKIFIVNVGERWQPSQVTPWQIFRVLYMMHIACTMEPETQVKGIVVIFDFKGMQMKQLWALAGVQSRATIEFMQKAMPLRLKEIHLINHPASFTTLFPLCKPFIGTKLYKRVFFHGDDVTSLHRFVDPSRLPEDFGGSLAKVEFTGGNWYDVLLEVEEGVREWCTFGFV